MYVEPAKKERKKFKMSAFRKGGDSDGDDDDNDDDDDGGGGGGGDSEQPGAQKSKLPHWLAAPAPQDESAKRNKKRNQSIKVGNPLFDGANPKKTTIDNPLNTVSNPLLATMHLASDELSSDSDDNDTVSIGLTGQHLSAFGKQEQGGASAADVQATLDFKKTKAFMSRRTTIS